MFALPEWKKLGFKRACDTWRRDFSRLGVENGPSVDTIIGRLKTPENTLPDLNTAATWFEHLLLHGGGLYLALPPWIRL